MEESSNRRIGALARFQRKVSQIDAALRSNLRSVRKVEGVLASRGRREAALRWVAGIHPFVCDRAALPVCSSAIPVDLNQYIAG
jgi:hypothetical protein